MCDMSVWRSVSSLQIISSHKVLVDRLFVDGPITTLMNMSSTPPYHARPDQPPAKTATQPDISRFTSLFYVTHVACNLEVGWEMTATISAARTRRGLTLSNKHVTAERDGLNDNWAPTRRR